MECRNHPSVSAQDRCSGCAEAFCYDCLVSIHGQLYCGSCKMMTVKGPPAPRDGDIPCETAGKALTYAIIGIFCFGFILGPMAIAKAVEAKREIAEDPDLCGLAKANVALLLGIAVLIFWVLGMISRFKDA